MLMPKNKNIFYLIIILNLFSYNSFAQKYKKPKNLVRYDHQKIHFGFTLGINNLNFNYQKIQAQ